MGGLICGSMVGHFWTFLLKPPQPLMGLFLQIPPQFTRRKFVLRYLALLFIPGGTLEFYCKGCEMVMQCDKMFQCVTCKNYCLCKTCERQGTHPQHNMLCIRNNASDTVCKTNIYERNLFLSTGIRKKIFSFLQYGLMLDLSKSDTHLQEILDPPLLLLLNKS